MQQFATAADLKKLLATACKEVGGQKTWADSNKVSPQYVHDVINGRRLPGKSIAKALGFSVQRVFVAEQKGKAKRNGTPSNS